MCNLKANVISKINVATETISESLRQYLSNIPGKHAIEKLHKPAILYTAHKLWEVLV